MSLQNVNDATSAQAAWDALAERYEGKGKQRGVHLITEVFRTAFTDSEPLGNQINRFLYSVYNRGEHIASGILMVKASSPYHHGGIEVISSC
jgi:hypothetical protein